MYGADQGVSWDLQEMVSKVCRNRWKKVQQTDISAGAEPNMGSQQTKFIQEYQNFIG